MPRYTTLPAEYTENSPSSKDGIDVSQEFDHRLFGAEVIQECSILLRVPQVVAVTGQIIFQRFYFGTSLRKFDAFYVSMGCLLIATKIEEQPRRLDDILNVYHHVYQRRNNINIIPLLKSSDRYSRWLNKVKDIEREILAKLGYCIYSVVEHPHKFVLYYIKFLEPSSNAYNTLAQRAWNCLNDMLRLDLCIKYKSNVQACAAIYIAARMEKIYLPDKPPTCWWSLFDVDEKDLIDICDQILDLYYNTKKVVWVDSLIRHSKNSDSDNTIESIQDKTDEELRCLVIK